MPQADQGGLLEVRMECDEILRDYFRGVVTASTLKRARDGLNLRTYDRGPEFGREVIREFNRRLAKLEGCAGSC